jgi:hypothetical protein
MTIFHYTKTECAALILERLELRLSLPNEFNDPFEFLPLIDPKALTRDRFVRMAMTEDAFEDWWDNPKAVRISGDKNWWRDWYFKNPDKVVDELFPHAAFVADDMRKQFSDITSAAWAVGCFSKTEKSILMWSHYANQHRGVVIGFNTAVEPFTKSDQLVVLEVNYDPKRVLYPYPESNEDFERVFHAIAQGKHMDWSYEQEVRVLAVPGALREYRFLKLQTSAVESVIFGCKCPESDRKQVLRILDTDAFKHVKRYETRMSDTDYRIEPVERARNT